MAGKFTADLSRLTEKAKANMDYIAKQAIQDVLEGAQQTQPGVKQTGGSFEVGKIPVETGDLVNSLSVDGGGTGADAYVVAIAGMRLGDVMEFEWTMPYAARLHYGFTGEDSLGRHYEVPGRFWVSENAAKFQQFVDARAKEVET